MAMQTLSTTAQSTGDQATHARIREVAVEQFGQHGFSSYPPSPRPPASTRSD
jgi:hypothetical protein